MTTVDDGLFQYGGMPVTPGVPVPFTGKAFFVDPVNGSDGNPGTSPQRAFATLYMAHSKMTSGNNDVCYLIGNGAVSGAAVLSKALAITVDSTATTGTFTWSKNACHLIGITAPTGVAQRALIQPPSGDGTTTYTMATFGSGNVVVVTGSGCYFANFHVKAQFSTGGVNCIAWTDNGQRNCYNNVHFGGIMDAASAADTGARSLKIGSGGNGEHTFIRCTIGVDTVSRSVANASLELAGATPRNRFTECVFPLQASQNAPLIVLGTGNGCVDRSNIFERCLFINNIKSTSTTQSVAVSFTTAAPGGLLVLKDCDTVGFTKVGDTNGLANTYVSNVGGAATGGLDLNPS